MLCRRNYLNDPLRNVFSGKEGSKGKGRAQGLIRIAMGLWAKILWGHVSGPASIKMSVSRKYVLYIDLNYPANLYSFRLPVP